jgi:predicted transcriptional regulator
VKNRRSKLELYLDVLDVIKEGTIKPTRIMYGANLSWKLVQDILSSLVTQGLIDETDLSTSRDKRTNRVYHITQKGESVIKYFNQAKKLIEVDEPEFKPIQIVRDR